MTEQISCHLDIDLRNKLLNMVWYPMDLVVKDGAEVAGRSISWKLGDIMRPMSYSVSLRIMDEL